MAEALPELLYEKRQRESDTNRKLTPAAAKELVLLDTNNQTLAEQVENAMLLDEAASLGERQ
jgi:hypothetical protein